MKLREVRADSDFNDLFNRNNIEFLEWIVMKRLGLTHQDVHGKVNVYDTKLERVNFYDARKVVDFHFYYEEYEFIIEMNNNSNGSYIRNMLYLSTICLNKYKRKSKKTMSKEEIKKIGYYKYTNTYCLISLNWFKRDVLKEVVEPREIINIPASALKDKNLFEIEHINLDKYKNTCCNDVTDEEKLYKLLTIEDEEELKSIIKNEPKLEDYCSKIIELSKKEENMWTKELEENTRAADSYMGGYTVGVIEERAKVIANFNAAGVPVEVIAKAVGMQVSEVLEIIKSGESKVA